MATRRAGRACALSLLQPNQNEYRAPHCTWRASCAPVGTLNVESNTLCAWPVVLTKFVMLNASANNSMRRPPPTFSCLVNRTSMFLAGGGILICERVSGAKFRDARNALIAESCEFKSPRPTVRAVPGVRSAIVSPSMSQPPQLASSGGALMTRAIPLSCRPTGSASDAEIARLWRESVGL